MKTDKVLEAAAQKIEAKKGRTRSKRSLKDINVVATVESLLITNETPSVGEFVQVELKQERWVDIKDKG